MKNLLYKELRLAFHPTAAIFWLLSAMLLIPSYPYTVILFYTMLGIFFVCLTGRENHDLAYTLSLPVRKRDLVRGRFALVLLVEGVQLLLAVPFALIRQRMPPPGNMAGIDANLAFFAFALLIYGLFNLLFLPRYYRRPDKVGKAFGLTCVPMGVLILLLEALTYLSPFVRDRLDTPDPQFLLEKLFALAAGALLYGGLTWLAYRLSARAFERLDL